MNKDHHPESGYSGNLQYGYFGSGKHTSFRPLLTKGLALPDEQVSAIPISKAVGFVKQTIRLGSDMGNHRLRVELLH